MPAEVSAYADLPALLQVAGGRDYIGTAEFARAISRADQTVRKNYCLHGHSYGICPVKIGNRLLWPVAKIAALLGAETAR